MWKQNYQAMKTGISRIEMSKWELYYNYYNKCFEDLVGKGRHTNRKPGRSQWKTGNCKRETNGNCRIEKGAIWNENVTVLTARDYTQPIKRSVNL